MTKIALLVLIASLFSISSLACAQLTAPDTRVVSPKEMSAFHAFYLERFPNDSIIAPEFTATRHHGDKKWMVRASVFTFPERGYRNLCKVDEFRYVYDGGVWREDKQLPLLHTAWLDAGTDCSRQAKHISLNQPLPDADVIELLTQGNAVLKQAAIMLRGNTKCSLVHVGSLQLTSIGTGLYHHEMMLEFGYAGGEHDRVSLLVRRIRQELTTWGIDCLTR